MWIVAQAIGDITHSYCPECRKIEEEKIRSANKQISS
jgi:hypothetical protein